MCETKCNSVKESASPAFLGGAVVREVKEQLLDRVEKHHLKLESGPLHTLRKGDWPHFDQVPFDHLQRIDGLRPRLLHHPGLSSIELTVWISSCPTRSKTVSVTFSVSAFLLATTNTILQMPGASDHLLWTAYVVV
jgi:hypothetical protein